MDRSFNSDTGESLFIQSVNGEYVLVPPELHQKSNIGTQQASAELEVETSLLEPNVVINNIVQNNDLIENNSFNVDNLNNVGYPIHSKPKPSKLQYVYSYREYLTNQFLSSINLHPIETMTMATSNPDNLSAVISSPTQQYIPVKMEHDGNVANVGNTAITAPSIVAGTIFDDLIDKNPLIPLNERITITSIGGSIMLVSSVNKIEEEEADKNVRSLVRIGKNKLAFENFKLLERRNKATSYGEFLYPAGVFEDDIGLTHDPRDLDYCLTGDNARTVIALPSFLGTVVMHTTEQDANRLVESRFKRKAHSSLSIRLLHQLRKDMIEVAINSGMELSTTTAAIVLMEKLVLKSKLTRQTRKHHAVGCLSLACKVNEMHAPETLSDFCNRILDVPPKEFKAAEWKTFVDLEFTVYVSRKELEQHLQKLYRECGSLFPVADPLTDELSNEFIEMEREQRYNQQQKSASNYNSVITDDRISRLGSAVHYNYNEEDKNTTNNNNNNLLMKNIPKINEPEGLYLDNQNGKRKKHSYKNKNNGIIKEDEHENENEYDFEEEEDYEEEGELADREDNTTFDEEESNLEEDNKDEIDKQSIDLTNSSINKSTHSDLLSLETPQPNLAIK